MFKVQILFRIIFYVYGVIHIKIQEKEGHQFILDDMRDIHMKIRKFQYDQLTNNISYQI